MPVCPNCGYEYVKGMTICPDCQKPLVDEKLFIKPEEWTEENWEVVYTSNEEYEINMLKDNLEGAGITATMLSQKDRNFPSPGDFSIVKLLVKKEDVQDALNFIQSYLNEPDKEEPEAE
jgi:hypothetical protein